MKRTSFDNFHPAVAATYFAFVIVFCMAAFHPVLVATSLVAGFAASAYLRGWREAGRTASWQLPMLLLIGLVNPLFSANGSTLLCVLGPFPIYLESFVYGLTMGAMLVAAMLWFSNVAHILTSASVTALTGARMPVVGLMISMAMRLVPQFVRRGKMVAAAADASTAARCPNVAPSLFAQTTCAQGEGAASTRQCALRSAADRGNATAQSAAGGAAPGGAGHASTVRGAASDAGQAGRQTTDAQRRGPSDGALAVRVRQLSVLMGWSMEDSLDTSDAMRARGWGATPRRTVYRRRGFGVVDGAVLIVLVAVAACVVVTTVAVCAQSSFYPAISLGPWWVAVLFYIIYLALPAVLEVREWIRWR